MGAGLDILKAIGPREVLIAVLVAFTLILVYFSLLLRTAIKNKVSVNLQITRFFKLVLTPLSADPSLNRAIKQDFKEIDVLPPLGGRIREHRLARRLKQYDVGNHLGVSSTYISQVESGKRLLMRKDMEALIVFFQLSESEASELRHIFAEES